MSTVQVQSTTDTPEQVTAATAAPQAKEPVEKTDAVAADAAKTAEKLDASDATKQETTEGAAEAAAEESEEEGEIEGSTDEGTPKKPLKGFKKRIDKLNKRASQAEQERDYWRQEALKAKPQETKPVDAKKEVPQVGKPKADDFTSHEAFLEALTDWKVDQRDKQKETKTREAHQKDEEKRVVERFREGAKTAKEKFADYDEVLEANETPIPRHITGLLYHSENGPELSYHLAKNESELARICKLDQVTAARELGKFEAKFISAPEKETKENKTTKAPPPIKPVGSKTAATTDGYRDDMTYAEYKAWRNKSLRKRA